MGRVCVVIPVHSPNPSQNELISFEQCFRVLGKHPIKVIAPEGMDLNIFKNIVADFEIVYIDSKWQSSLKQYNKLKRSRFFYNLFKEFEFLLTYELDAFVFEDKLTYWCDKGYDYIGAPWFEGYTTPGEKFLGVGNSGFSLRRVAPIRKILKSLYYQNPVEFQIGKRTHIMAYLKMPYRWLKNQTGENYTVQNNYHHHEDIFFCHTVPAKYKDFKLASLEDAIKFSFEARPEYLFQLNNKELPMGCHAWWRYNLSFWRPYIESLGYRIDSTK